MQLGIAAAKTHPLVITGSALLFMTHVTLDIGHGDATLYCVMHAIPMVFVVLVSTSIHVMLLRRPSSVVSLHQNFLCPSETSTRWEFCSPGLQEAPPGLTSLVKLRVV
eukprot:11038121-Ditylum_brightwellii.AAC.1